MPQETRHNISRHAELVEGVCLCQMAEAARGVRGEGVIPIGAGGC